MDSREGAGRAEDKRYSLNIAVLGVVNRLEQFDVLSVRSREFAGLASQSSHSFTSTILALQHSQVKYAASADDLFSHTLQDVDFHARSSEARHIRRCKERLPDGRAALAVPVDVLNPPVKAVGDVQALAVVRARAEDAVGHERARPARLDARLGDAVLVDDEDARKRRVRNEQVLRLEG